MFEGLKKGIRKFLGLEPPDQTSATQFEVGVVNNRLIIKFSQPVVQLELNRIQTLNLIEALTKKVSLTHK